MNVGAEDEANAFQLMLVPGIDDRWRRIDRSQVVAAVLVVTAVMVVPAVMVPAVMVMPPVPANARRMDIPPIIETQMSAIMILTTVELNLLARVFEVLIVTFPIPGVIPYRKIRKSSLPQSAESVS